MHLPQTNSLDTRWPAAREAMPRAQGLLALEQEAHPVPNVRTLIHTLLLSLGQHWQAQRCCHVRARRSKPQARAVHSNLSLGWTVQHGRQVCSATAVSWSTRDLYATLLLAIPELDPRTQSPSDLRTKRLAAASLSCSAFGLSKSCKCRADCDALATRDLA